MSYNCRLSDFYCNACTDLENGSIRGVAWVRIGAPIPDPTSLQDWKNLVCNGFAVIIPATVGTSDGGAAVEISGYGDEISTLTGMNFTASYRHPWTIDNQDFYNQLQRSIGYEFWYATENKLWRAGKSSFKMVQVPITEDKASQLEFVVGVKWSSKDQPYAYDATTVVQKLFKDCETSSATLDCFSCQTISLVNCGDLG